MELGEFYQTIGSDAGTVIKRLGLTEKHLKKYLKKFLANREFAELSQVAYSGNHEAVEWHAHTLKGIVSNLGFDHLFVTFQKIVNCVREGKGEDVQSLFEEARTEYEKITFLLSQVNLNEE